MAPTVSRTLESGGSNGAACHESRMNCDEDPIPTDMVRPPSSWLTVAASMARSAGDRVDDGTTATPRSSRVVLAAIAPRRANVPGPATSAAHAAV